MSSPGWRRGFTASSTASRRRGRRLRGGELERSDARLLRLLEADFAAAAESAGSLLACGPGCNECCHGPFPVTRLDAWRLRRGMEMARSERLEARAREAVKLLVEDFPGDPASGRLSADEAELDRFFAEHEALPCPALDPESGRCDLYDWRPVSCRTYGPSARFGAENSPPCRLCFAGAGEGDIERCRMQPDREGLEDELLAGLGVVAGEEWETLIPFVLVRMYTVPFDDREEQREQT